MTAKLNLVHGKNTAHSSEEILRGVGGFYMPLATSYFKVATFSIAVAIF